MYLKEAERMDLTSQAVTASTSSSPVLHTVVTREHRNPAHRSYNRQQYQLPRTAHCSHQGAQ